MPQSIIPDPFPDTMIAPDDMSDYILQPAPFLTRLARAVTQFKQAAGTSAQRRHKGHIAGHDILNHVTQFAIVFVMIFDGSGRMKQVNVALTQSGGGGFGVW